MVRMKSANPSSVCSCWSAKMSIKLNWNSQQPACVTDVASKLDYSARGLKLALDKYAEDNGNATMDLRSHRGNAKSGASANGKAFPVDSDAA